MDDPKIIPQDQERIEQLVASFRTRIENLYRIGYIQGRIDEAQDAREMMRKAAA